MEIVNFYNGKIIFKADVKTMKDLVVLANLHRANLHRANLHEADLRGANLRGANLYEANLRGANLYEADLYEANLYEANLYEADLREADLREADLRGADLRGADLRGADLDFSSGIPNHCGGTQIKVDDRIVSQMLYHLTRQNTDSCSGGVQEAIEQIKQMAVADLFCEYRNELETIEKDK